MTSTDTPKEGVNTKINETFFIDEIKKIEKPRGGIKLSKFYYIIKELQKNNYIINYEDFIENGEIKKDNTKQYTLSDVIKDNTHKIEREALVEILKSDIITKGEDIIKSKSLLGENQKSSIEVVLEIVANNDKLSDTERAICIIYLKERQKENTREESKEDRAKVIETTKISKKYNFGNSEKIKNSLQKTINTGKNINDILTKNEKIKVSIINSKSYLRLRDDNENIIGHLGFNEEITYLGDTKQINNYIFIKVRTSDNKEGWVSCSYLVKEDISLALGTQANGANVDQSKGSTENVDQNSLVVSGTAQNQDSPANNVGSQDTQGSMPQTQQEGITGTRLVAYSQNGRNYIIGKDGNPKLFTWETLDPKVKNSLEKHKELSIKLENLYALLEALNQEDKNKDTKKELDRLMGNLNPLNIADFTTKVDTFLNNNFNKLDGGKVAKEKVNLENRLSVLKYIRDKLGNFNFALSLLSDDLFSITKINDLENFIENPSSNNAGIRKFFGKDYENFQIKVNEKKIEATNYFIKNKASLLKNHPELKGQEDLILKLIENTFAGGFAKTEILKKYIEKYPSSIKNNPSLNLFSDITGVGGEWYNISDANKFWANEGIWFIATEVIALAAGALTMGAGSALINSAVYGTRGVRILKYLYETEKIANASLKGTTLLQKGAILGAKTGRFVGMSVAEGTLFYAGHNSAKNVIEGNGVFDNYTNEAWGQSILYSGAFRALGGVYKALGKNIDYTKPLSQQKLKIGSQIFIEGTTILGINGLFLEAGEWSNEEIVQAYIMATLFKGVGAVNGKLIAKRVENGKIEIFEQKNGGKEKFSPEEVKRIAGELKQARENGQDGLPEGKYAEYAQEYQNYYNLLNTKSNAKEGSTVRTKSIEAYDKKIARDILAKEKLEKINSALRGEIKQEQEIVNDVINGNINEKGINRLFNKYFSEKMKKGKNTSLQIGEKTYTQRKNGKYEIEGDNMLYNKQEILEKIPIEDKKGFLQKIGKEKVNTIGEDGVINIKDGNFIFGKYKIQNNGNEILVKEGGRYRKLNAQEIEQFYKDHFEEILKSRGLDIQKDMGKLTESIKNSKGTNFIKAANDFLESIPGAGKFVYKPTINITKWLIQNATPYKTYKIFQEFKNSHGFSEKAKSILFGNKNSSWIGGSSLALAEILGLSMLEINLNNQNKGVDPLNAGLNYIEFLYLGFFGYLAVEYLNLDNKVIPK